MQKSTCVITFFYPGIEKKIVKFIKSLQNQSDKNFDLIIYFNNKKNFILPKNNFKIKMNFLNTSIIKSRFKMIKDLKNTKYKYIIFQDADDLMKKNRVEVCKKLLKKRELVINDLDIFGEYKLKKYFSKRIRNFQIISMTDISNYNFLGMSNTSIRSDCLKNINIPTNLKIKIFDWYFWTIILSKYKAIFTNLTSTKYYTRKTSPTCLPFYENRNNRLLKNRVKKTHLKEISKLIESKKIKNFYVSKKKIIVNNKYNFWWE